MAVTFGLGPPSLGCDALVQIVLRAVLPLLWGVFAGAALGSQPESGPALWSSLSDTLFTHHTDPEAGSGTAIVRDTNGFIWLGTQSGLVRWDGYHFRRYAADTQTPGSLPDSFILALHIDDRGRLWIGTSAGGLAQYDAERDSFTVAAGPSGVKGTAVFSITGDQALLVIAVHDVPFAQPQLEIQQYLLDAAQGGLPRDYQRIKR